MLKQQTEWNPFSILTFHCNHRSVKYAAKESRDHTKFLSINNKYKISVCVHRTFMEAIEVTLEVRCSNPFSSFSHSFSNETKLSCIPLNYGPHFDWSGFYFYRKLNIYMQSLAMLVTFQYGTYLPAFDSCVREILVTFYIGVVDKIKIYISTLLSSTRLGCEIAGPIEMWVDLAGHQFVVAFYRNGRS